METHEALTSTGKDDRTPVLQVNKESI